MAITLIIKKITSKIIKISISENATIKNLKQEICKEEETPIKIQALFLETDKDNELENEKTLNACGIRDKTIVLLGEAGRGGGQFEAPDVEKERIIKLGKSRFKYRRVKPGLNYGGKCENKDCEVYQEKVMVHRGFRSRIDPSRDEHFKNFIKCPCCHQKFNLRGFYFFQCHAVINYKKQGEEEITTIEKDVTDTWKLGGDDGKKATYLFLEFNVTRSPKQ